MLGLRERGREHVDCLECYERLSIARLLTGFTATDFPKLREELQQIKAEITTVGHSVRQLLRAIGPEVADCPRLFTIRPLKPTGLGRLNFFSDRYELTLWYEHPGYWHPHDQATYQLKSPTEWLTEIGPYARLVVGTLRILAPLTGVAAEIANITQVKAGVDAMKVVLDSLPKYPRSSGYNWQSNIGPLEGGGLRRFRQFLFKLDEDRYFGDMRRVLDPSGDFLWVCPHHNLEYDPGLPKLPG